MKKIFITRTFSFVRGSLLILMIHLLCIVNVVASEDEKSKPNAKKILPPPTPTVVLTLPSGSNCYSTLTASGCNVGNTVYWYRDSGFSFYNTGATITVTDGYTSVFLSAKCYDSGTGTFGGLSPEYKAYNATYTEITPNTTQYICSNTSTILFNASSAASGVTYQWYNSQGGGAISGATNSNYTATGGRYTDTYFSVSATLGSCTSNSNSVKVYNPIIPSSFPDSRTSCSTLYLSAHVDNPGGTFQWKLGGANISGATYLTYSTAYRSYGTYTVEYTTPSNGCVSSSLP